jgi:hypothetical protein
MSLWIYSNIFNGLLDVGFSIQQVQDRWLDPPDLPARPGSWAHWLAYLVDFAIVARKGSIKIALDNSL